MPLGNTPPTQGSKAVRPMGRWSINWRGFVLGPALVVVTGVIVFFTIPDMSAPLPTGSTRGFALLVIGFILLCWLLVLGGTVLFARHQQHAAETWIPATAQILEAGRTGTYVNELPRVKFRLLVSPPGMPAYEATVTKTMPPEGLVAMAPGNHVQVRVDPGNPKKVMFVTESPDFGGSADPMFGQGIPSAQAGGTLAGTSPVSARSAESLLDSGTRTVATVIAAVPSGQTIGSIGKTSTMGLPADSPLFTIQLDFQRTDGSPCQSAHMQAVPKDLTQRLEPGTAVPVAYDASDPTRQIVVDFDTWAGR